MHAWEDGLAGGFCACISGCISATGGPHYFEGICMGRRMDEYLDASIASCYHIANDIVEGFLLT